MDEVDGMRRVNTPAERIISEKVRKLGCLSASLPPIKYPTDREVITIPIRLPQTKMLSP